MLRVSTTPSRRKCIAYLGFLNSSTPELKSSGGHEADGGYVGRGSLVDAIGRDWEGWPGNGILPSFLFLLLRQSIQTKGIEDAK